MNLNLYFGKTYDGNELEIDLVKENIHTIFLTGTSGSGKSVLHYTLYKELTDLNSDYELGFVFMDMTRVDFVGWRGPYLHAPVITDPAEALDYFFKLSESPPKNRATVVHIEECDILLIDTEKFQKAWKNIHDSKAPLFVIFSTSRPSVDVFTKSIKDNTDMIISFNLATKIDSQWVLNNSDAVAIPPPGNKIISFNNKYEKLFPFGDRIVKENDSFHKYMTTHSRLTEMSQATISEQTEIIERCLKSFGIRAKVADINYLPNESVEYSLAIGIGTKFEEIEKRRRELALSLGSSTGTIDIQFPIPGTSYIGITVPKVSLSKKMLSTPQEPEHFLGSILFLVAGVLVSIAKILYYATGSIENTRNVYQQLVVVITVPYIIAALESGKFDSPRAFSYVLVSFVVWVLVLGVQRYGKRLQ